MPENAPHLGARNPFALAEAVVGHPIDWSSVPDKAAYLEEVLQMPYEQLFDPKFDSPVYLGARLDEQDQVVAAEYREPSEDEAAADADVALTDIHRLTDLAPLLGPLSEVSIRSFAPSRAGGWTVEVAPGGKLAQLAKDRLFTKRVLNQIWDPKRYIDFGWTPENGEWADTGSFFNEAAEYFDPIQGGLADCWLIAAMASVAWSMPTAIADRERATGTANSQFKHSLSYVDPDTGTTRTFEVSDQTVVWQGTTVPMYGHSGEDGEIWPPVVEKAFAQWRQGTTNDKPNLTILDYGDPVWASAALTGRKPHYFANAGMTPTALRLLVKSHCQSYRTVDPMTAWTYGTAPAGLSYSDATIVGNHAYSVLGWTSASILRRAVDAHLTVLGCGARAELLARPGIASLFRPDWFATDYIVLRNPWGNTEATRGALTGTIAMHDVDFWRSINLGDVDGVFAIDFATFQQYFAGTGVAL